MSKRKRQAILFFTYGFMTLATLVITAICLMIVVGYRFDITHGRLEQGGLLQFRSTPSGAAITVDGVKQDYLTPGKLDIRSGSHTVSMSKIGYGVWQKSITVRPGEVRWLNYARLVPDSISTVSRYTADSITSALQSPDRKYVVALSSASPTHVTIYDVRDPEKIVAKKYDIPDNVTGATGDQSVTLGIAEWDFGSRFLLLKSTVGDQTSYLRLDRTTENGDPINITKEFNLPFSHMHFSGTSGRLYYTLTGQDLRKVDLGAKSVTQPLVTDVVRYVLFKESDIAFVTKSQSGVNAGVYINDKATIVRSYADDPSVMVDISEYYAHHYLAIVLKNKLTIIKDPIVSAKSSTDFANITLPYEATWLDFANNGRFVSAGAGYALTTYDIETTEQSLVNNASNSPATKPVWVDDFYFADNQNGSARIYEYDGLNEHSITKAEPTLPVFFSDNGKFLYSFIRQNDKTVLQSSRLVLD